MKLVIKVTGKFFDDQGDKTPLSSAIRSLVQEGHRVALVTGGGTTARKYISLGRSLNLNEASLDLLGIWVARLNAFLMALSMPDLAYSRIPESLEQFLEYWGHGKVVVVGGFQPGQSTAAVSALVAEAISADYLVMVTTVEGVFDSDPKKNPNAKFLPRVTTTELKSILENTQSVKAGTYELLDPMAMKIVERSRIKVIVTSVDKIGKLTRIIKGEETASIVEPV
ncbi:MULTISPECIES: UMP kinase [Metallosphaera]|uniref:Uridylate kinase n=3 Tax=Metallosphaera TaxID=41980 RepID=PYRH_METS5|nr:MULTISPECIES: UMP kinase [Metallosphaera]A4YHL6.1 RecName: Full=Uridylate kinase; Short=UK; AltName: Full=Uridine monophosphate kinase; Short=UMP kinase; Short=UMPK [Metallosphaera sedula DSM 5348]ABP95918.1 uridylate kinase, putative [Metallosphaera sedula DSM 5348]AIM27902.1 uridylate kinase, putative [Metallosphaera sedula]AKV74739.1 uridylate kinase [Metallosphaera sedula]AKV76976.1 uridylate kinase [Metallosphaera sedula]AKV79227.1 uridylate kinase [Metallosphaera sedula]